MRILLLIATLVAGSSFPLGAQTDAAREWEKVFQTSNQLLLANKTTEAIAAVQRFLGRFPNFGDAQYEQARLYENLADTPGTAPDARRRHLENAVRHYQRAGELITSADAKFVIAWKVLQLHEADALDKPAEVDRYARRLIADFPARPETHLIYARVLHERGDLAGALDVMRKGRAVAKDPPGAWFLTLLQYSIERVQGTANLPREEVRRLLDDTIALADERMTRPADEREFRLWTMGKSMAIELKAERLELQNRAQRAALLVESERYSAPLDQFVKGVPPARRPTPAQIAEIEARAFSRWSMPMIAAGRFADAVALMQRYISDYPSEPMGYEQLASMYVQWADAATDARTKAARLEQALVPAQRVIGLALTGDAREYAFRNVIDLLGPEKLNRPEWIEEASRTQAKRYPMDAIPHTTLAIHLFRTGRADEADAALKAGRAGLKSTAAARASLASPLLGSLLNSMPPADQARRMFAAASALAAEAEKLGPNTADALEIRAAVLRTQAERFESDPARAKKIMAQAEDLMRRALAIRSRK